MRKTLLLLVLGIVSLSPGLMLAPK
jgi:hypothetical protein